MFGKFWRAFHRKLAVFVQGKLCSISKLLCHAVYDLSFISKINCTALPCLFFVISFRCCCVEFPRRYRSCLLAQGNISRLAWCLVRIVLKLRRFRKPTVRVLKSGAWCKYLTSIHEYIMSSHKPVLAWTIGVGYTSNLKSYCTLKNNSHWIRVLHYCCLLLAASMVTTIEQLPAKDRLSQQFS